MTTIDPLTSPIDEIRDWLAERVGWTSRPYVSRRLWSHPKMGETFDHPYPPTLDGAASAMPEGWWFWINYCAINGKECFYAQAVHKQLCNRVDCESPTEMEARYRLAAACILAEEQANA